MKKALFCRGRKMFPYLLAFALLIGTLPVNSLQVAAAKAETWPYGTADAFEFDEVYQNDIRNFEYKSITKEAAGNLGYTCDQDTLVFRNVDFGLNGPKSFTASVAPGGGQNGSDTQGSITVLIDCDVADHPYYQIPGNSEGSNIDAAKCRGSATDVTGGTTIAEVAFTGNNFSSYTNQSVAITKTVTGVHDVYIRLGMSNGAVNIQNFAFEANEQAIAPWAPTDVAAQAGDGQVRLSWNAPENIVASSVTKYEVKKAGDEVWTEVTGAREYTFSGLDNGTAYTFSVRAYNGEIPGAETEVSATPNAGTEPEIPTVDAYQQNFAKDFSEANDVVVEEGTGNIGYINDGSWVKYANVDFGASSPVGFDLHYAIPETDATVDLMIGSRDETKAEAKYSIPLTVTGGWQKYETKSITLKNASFTGTKDIYLVFRGAMNVMWWEFKNQDDLARPAAPQKFKAEPGNGKVMLSWTAPTYTGNSEISSYEVDKDGNWIDVGNVTAYTVTGLTNDMPYTFKVRAVNASGSGAEATATATPTNWPYDRVAANTFQAVYPRNERTIGWPPSSIQWEGENLGYTSDTDTLVFKNVDFGTNGPAAFLANASADVGTSGTITVKIDCDVDENIKYTGPIHASIDEDKYCGASSAVSNGTTIAEVTFTGTGYGGYEDRSANITEPVTGKHDVYIILGMQNGGAINIKNFAFTENEKPVEPAQRTISLTSRVDGTTDGTTVVTLKGGGTFEASSVRTVEAPEKDGYEFKGWYLADSSEQGYGGNAISNNLSYTFELKADISLVAVYTANAKVRLSITGINFTVNNGSNQATGSYSQEFNAGTKITLAATGANFAYWMNSSKKIVSTSAQYEFTLVGNAEYTPVYKNAEANSAFVEFVSDYGQIMQAAVYGASESFGLPSGPSKMGYRFTGWSMTAEEIQAAIAAGTTYIKVTPVYEALSAKYTVTVNYVGTDDAQSAEEYKDQTVGSTMTLTAKTIAGRKFSHWASDRAGLNVLGTSENYYIAITGDVVIYAVYVEEAAEVEKKPVIAMTDIFTLHDGNKDKLAFSATRDIPQGYTLVEQGMLYALVGGLDNGSMIIGGSNVLQYKAASVSEKGVFTLYVNVTGHTEAMIYTRGYVIVKNNTTGNLETYYSEISNASYNTANQ